MSSNGADGKLKGTNLKVTHVHNQRVVLETVRLRGPLSRAEIAEFTDLTPQTISNIVDKLLDRGVLHTVGRRTGMRGQPAIEIDLKPTGGYGIGVHLDRDLLTVVLLDLSGRCCQLIRHEWNFPTPDEALPLIAELVPKIASQQGLNMTDLWGVGVALPGPLDLAAGAPIDPPNFPGWDGVPLRDLLSAQLNLPVFLETDATAAAEGERWFGQGRDLDDYFYIYFGVGLGGGMIVSGKPYVGAFGNAAMFGHVPVDPKGERCSCGGIGCLELYASLTSLFAAMKVRTVDDIEPLDFIHLLESGDTTLLGWLDSAADRLVTALVSIEHLLSPSAIIFGGHLPAPLGQWLIDKIGVLLPERRMRALKSHPKIILSEILESAAALGAATLPLFSEFALVSSFASAAAVR